MNWLDIWLAIAMIISIITGLTGGFAKTGIAFLASILGLGLGLVYYHQVGLLLREHIERRDLANIAGFLIVFAVVTVAGGLIGSYLSRFVKATHLTWLDRILGGAFGIVRGLWIATLTIWALMAFLPVTPKTLLSGSRFAPAVMDAARRVADASPEEVQRTFKQSYRELNKVLPENIKHRLSNISPSQI